MPRFRAMDRYSSIACIFIFILASRACGASHVRKLIAGTPNNVSAAPQVAPTGSPANESNTASTDAGKSRERKQKEPQMENDGNGSMALANGSNKDSVDSKNSSSPGPSASEKNVDVGNGKDGNATTMPKSGDSGSCGGSLTRCRNQEMLACIESSKGSKQVFLVVQNEGENTLKVDVKFPNYLSNDIPAFEVPKHETRRIDISSSVGKSAELIVDSGIANCTLPMVRSASVDNLIPQLSFFSKQVTPTYAAYASILVALIFVATWACCKLRKRNQENVIPYQELEMGLPQSISAVNQEATEGWDQDWDDDDWEEDNVVRSPVRSVSVGGLASRPSKNDGWENDWAD